MAVCHAACVATSKSIRMTKYSYLHHWVIMHHSEIPTRERWQRLLVCEVWLCVAISPFHSLPPVSFASRGGKGGALKKLRGVYIRMRVPLVELAVLQNIALEALLHVRCVTYNCDLVKGGRNPRNPPGKYAKKFPTNQCVQLCMQCMVNKLTELELSTFSDLERQSSAETEGVSTRCV